MTSTNQRKISLILSCFFIAMLIPLTGISQTTIEIQVAPNVLNLQNQGQVVTIHTDVAYSLVETESVYLNGVEIESWKADNQGNFVAKFNMDAIQGLESLVVGEYNTFTLEGTTYSGEAFIGEEDILVVNNIPKGKK